MKVAIIGGGASGLTSIKCCLDEGLEPVCFEQDDYIGGMWQFTEDRSKTSSVYRSTVINTSKEMMCFSDFPIPKEFPPYMHNRDVLKYLKMYANHFALEKFIRFGCAVISVKKAQDFPRSGRWIVTSTSSSHSGTTKESETVIEEFGAVMACTGHHWQASWPSFKGMDVFHGVQMHSHSYKDFKAFEGKTVLVVGIGNSAVDISVELSRHAKQVYLSTRRGAWVVSRLHTAGLPADQCNLTRFHELLPLTLKEYISRRTCNARFSHENYGLTPTHGISEQHPIINDALPYQIITGSLIIKPDVKELLLNGVEFNDGTSVASVDVVIFCTGYDIRFPYLEMEQDIIKPGNQVQLYKYVFPPFLENPTLAVVGNVQPSGAVNPVSELQARWAVRVFAKKIELPTKGMMMRDIRDKWETIWKQYYRTKRNTIKVEYISYCDELAAIIGCKPNLLKLFICDPLTSFKCFFGPCTPPQYRLMGPGAWSGAKQAIQDVSSNVIHATKTRVVEKRQKSFSRSELINVLVVFALIMTILIILYFLI